jgi:hypothetical protein
MKRIFLALLVFVTSAAHAQLTAGQFSTLKAAVIADATAGPMRTAGDAFSLLAWCNAAKASTPAWRVASAQDADEAATYTSYDSLVAGKRDSWAIFLRGSRDFGKAKVRSWVVDVWGAATAASISESILQAGTENATNAQAAIGGPSAATGTVTAVKRNYDQQVTASEAARLLN